LVLLTFGVLTGLPSTAACSWFAASEGAPTAELADEESDAAASADG
jgi:hypothetical protein